MVKCSLLLQRSQVWCSAPARCSPKFKYYKGLSDFVFRWLCGLCSSNSWRKTCCLLIGTVEISVFCFRFGDVKGTAVRRHDGVGSDGHLAHVFRHAAKELFGEHVEEVTYRALRLEPAHHSWCTQEWC